MKKVFRILLLVLVAAAAVICLIYRDRIDLDLIMSYTPEDLWLACAVLLMMFAFKSLSMVIYAGLLYTASGILLPFIPAIAVNLLGTAIMVSLPYCIGRYSGSDTAEKLLRKYPKLGSIKQLRARSDFAFAFLIRLNRILPADPLSLYMGAVRSRYLPYLTGSLLSMLPSVLSYQLAGTAISDRSSAAFLIALGAEGILTICSVVLLRIYSKKTPPVPRNDEPPREQTAH